eukprot:Gb_04523 [translate_table: standard]
MYTRAHPDPEGTPFLPNPEKLLTERNKHLKELSTSSDVPTTYGMLLSRSWGAKLGGTIQLDMTYATMKKLILMEVVKEQMPIPCPTHKAPDLQFLTPHKEASSPSWSQML